MKNRVSSIALLTLTMVIWGSSYVITKVSLNAVPPISFALIRMSVASVLLLILVQVRGGISKMQRPVPWMTIALMGLTGTCLYYICFNMALSYTSASNAAIIQSFIPIVTALLAFIFLKETLPVKHLFGMGISTVGVLLIIFLSGPGGKAKNLFLGNMLMLSTVLFWSIYTILAKRLANIDPVAVTAYSIAFGTLLLIPATVFELYSRPLPAISAKSWLSAIYLGSVSSAACLLLYNRSLKHLDASQTAGFLNLMPVIGVMTAVLFLGEKLTLWQIGGGALVLAGVLISLRK
jgi:drug/metabolite transporter (DMT)-like permease